MQKLLIIVVAVVCSASAMPNLLGGQGVIATAANLPKLTNDIVSPLPAVPVLTGSNAVSAIVNNLLGLATNGATVQFDDGPLTLGSVALPSLVTCQTPVVRRIACHICNLDCVYVHNTYGGSCTVDPYNATKGFECVCQDERNDNGTVSTPVQVCGSILGGGSLDAAVDLGLQGFLYARQSSELCYPLGDGKFSSVGCNTDCRKNHQYASGVCQVAPTIPFNADQTPTTNNGEGQYCVCSGKSTDPIDDPSAAPTIDATS